ncbi:hypothetical protein F4809DRAFT_588691 [Biscogniauxia mediterranea]|nr:hypothetical protein F4809DRAFT_588691 [Biscogniauxia mediterranea]
MQATYKLRPHGLQLFAAAFCSLDRDEMQRIDLDDLSLLPFFLFFFWLPFWNTGVTRGVRGPGHMYSYFMLFIASLHITLRFVSS